MVARTLRVRGKNSNKTAEKPGHLYFAFAEISTKERTNPEGIEFFGAPRACKQPERASPGVYEAIRRATQAV
jgi:hypothetical protein